MDTDWLPEGKDCCVCFSIDDTHPATSSDGYEAGGDLGNGQLGNVKWLLDRHEKLKVTLFITANWRETTATPTRKILSKLPYVKDRFYLARRWPKDKMRIDRHPEFVKYLNSLPRTELGYHGLYHCHTGSRIAVEFQEQTKEEMVDALKEIESIFDRARMRSIKGFCPPGWNAPSSMIGALTELDFRFIASARDLNTPVSRDAVTNMSGLKGVSLIFPEKLNDRLVHFTTNFQATSTFERAREILDVGGLLKVKAHIRKLTYGRMNIDGLDMAYANYLDLLFDRIEREYGEKVWWASMGEVAGRILNIR